MNDQLSICRKKKKINTLGGAVFSLRPVFSSTKGVKPKKGSKRRERVVPKRNQPSLEAAPELLGFSTEAGRV
jgi:hypothetical protein